MEPRVLETAAPWQLNTVVLVITPLFGCLETDLEMAEIKRKKCGGCSMMGQREQCRKK